MLMNRKNALANADGKQFNRKVQIEHDRQIYKQRNVVERMVCRFKDWRRRCTL